MEMKQSGGGLTWKRLMSLLEHHHKDILKRESAGTDGFIYLYDAGEYWVAFEQSACRLRQLFPDCDIIVLHCNTEYPTPMADVNLRAMDDLRRSLGVEVGYSDHTKGIEVPIAAVALGATVIEKHFTLDKTMEGPDHKASLEPDELKAMVDAIRNIEQALGDGHKHVSPSERKNMDIARKSIVAARDIRKGEVLTEENITTKRPGNGISPMRWDSVIGTTAIRDFGYDELIEM